MNQRARDKFITETNRWVIATFQSLFVTASEKNKETHTCLINMVIKFRAWSVLLLFNREHSPVWCLLHLSTLLGKKGVSTISEWQHMAALLSQKGGWQCGRGTQSTDTGGRRGEATGRQPIFVPPTHPHWAGDKWSVPIVFFQMLRPRWEIKYCSKSIVLCLITAEHDRRRSQGYVGEMHLRHDEDPADLGQNPTSVVIKTWRYIWVTEHSH